MTRVAAWSCLRAGSEMPLREVDRAARERELDSRDRALVRALVGTEVRRRGTLRAMVDRFARGKPNPDLAAHMRLGLAQLFFLDRIPDHAAVSTTVAAVGETLGLSKTRYANAVLRAAIRARREGKSGDPRRDLVGRDLHLDKPTFRDPAEHPSLWAEDALSIPAHLFKRWSKRYGAERARALSEWFLTEPPLCVRAVRVEREALFDELAAAGAEPERGAHPRTVICPAARTENVTASDAFRQGRATIQGATGLAAAELVAAEAGERVLDLCAAPGGKTAVLAETGAKVVAVDDDEERLERLRETLERLSLERDVEVCKSDGTAALAARDFDAVLVDAPCSNTGVLGARPAARWRFGPKNLAKLGALQERLLAEGAAKVRAGGRLVWSTCSLEPEENAQRVRRFLAENRGFELAEEREALPGVDGPADGGYAALLRKR